MQFTVHSASFSSWTRGPIGVVPAYQHGFLILQDGANFGDLLLVKTPPFSYDLLTGYTASQFVALTNKWGTHVARSRGVAHQPSAARDILRQVMGDGLLERVSRAGAEKIRPSTLGTVIFCDRTSAAH